MWENSSWRILKRGVNNEIEVIRMPLRNTLENQILNACPSKRKLTMGKEFPKNLTEGYRFWGCITFRFFCISDFRFFATLASRIWRFQTI